jgi:regulation of enolase protein 1 (concanavalin A-like superfamily)
MDWHNEPATWREDGDRLTAVVEGDTDCWRYTRHGFVTDDAHAYLRSVSGDFTATVAFDAGYDTQYDQAGLLVRADAETWLKCGVEYVDGTEKASAVVTREYSDWSVAPLDDGPLDDGETVWTRVERIDEAVEVAVSTDGEDFRMIRQAYLGEGDELRVGPMAAAPQGDGFEVTFEDFAVETP